jgi:hypothetical protein
MVVKIKILGVGGIYRPVSVMTVELAPSVPSVKCIYSTKTEIMS